MSSFIGTTKILLSVLALFVLPSVATNHFVGIGAANSAGGASSYTCRTAAQWNTVAADAKNNGFKSIRITGFDCNALELASAAAASHGLTVLAGIFASAGTIAASKAQIDNDVQAFRAAHAKYGAARYAGLTIGNEMNDSVGNIMAKVYDVRGYLGSVGIKTPVSTVHTWVKIRDNPALCGADFVGANAHAFYDGGRTSGQAGDFVFKTVVPALKAKCPGKKVIITESGWPSRGAKFGVATPSVNDERSALSSLNCAARSDTSVSVYAFEVDDQLWKANDNERSFGTGKVNLPSTFSSC